MKQRFDIGWIKSKSYSGKLITKVAEYLKGQLNNPDQAFINLLKNELPLPEGVRIDDETLAKSVRKVKFGPQADSIDESSEQETTIEDTSADKTTPDESSSESKDIIDEAEEKAPGETTGNGYIRNGTDDSSNIEDDFELTPTDDNIESELEDELKASDLHRSDNDPGYNGEQTSHSPVRGNGGQDTDEQSTTSTQQSVQPNVKQAGNYRPSSPELRKKREEGLDLMKSIIEEVIADHRIGEQHYKGYSDLVVNGMEENPIVRYHYADETKHLGLFDANNMEYKIPIDSLEDIHQFADQIKLLARKYDEKS